MTRMTPRKRENSPNDDCLSDMAAHIMYEIDGFRKGFEKWKELSSQEASADHEAFNKAVEVALLHYRTLLEFFRSNPRQVTVDENISIDIVATDYLGGSTGESISEEAEQLCNSYKGRIDQQLCHISTGRRKGNIWREWPTGMMKEKMEGLICQFKQNLPQERSSWFSSLTNAHTELMLSEVSNGTCTLEERPFPMPLAAPSASRR